MSMSLSASAGTAGGKWIKASFLSVIWLVPLAVLVFSPHLALYLALIVLCLMSGFDNKLLRNVLGVTAIVAGSLCAASRIVGVTPSDDFANHYQWAYKAATTGTGFFYYGSEILITSYFRVLALLFEAIPQNKIMFFVSLLSSGMFLLWINKYALRLVPKTNRGLLMAMCLGFFSFAQTTQLMRQFLAFPIMLFAISSLLEGDRRKGFIFAVVATFAHITSAPIVAMFYLIIRYGTKLGVVLVCVSGVLAVMVQQNIAYVLYAVSSIPGASQFYDIFSYYATDHDNNMLASLIYNKKALLILLLSFVPLRYWVTEFRAWSPVFRFGCVIYFIFSIIPNGERAMLILPSCLFGFWLYAVFYDFKLLRSVAIGFFTLALFFPAGIFDRNPDFALWWSYDWWGAPFYYLSY